MINFSSILINIIIILLIFFTIYLLSVKVEYFHFRINNNKKIKNHNIIISGGFFIIISVFIINFIHPLNYVNNIHLFLVVLFFILGFFDDSFDLGVKIRIIVQIFLATLTYFFLFWTYDPLLEFFLFSNLSSKFLASIFIIFFIVLYVNSFNFIDGVDGLAGTQALLAILFCYFIYSSFYKIFSYEYLISIIFIFSIFICFNLQNLFLRKIYLGNSGSFFLGSFLVIFLININLDYDAYHPFIILWLSSYPLFNLFRVVLLRMLLRKNPFLPDRLHLHHQLEDRNISHLSITLIISMLYFLFFLFGFWSTINFIPEINLVIFILTFFVYFFSTNIVTKSK